VVVVDYADGVLSEDTCSPERVEDALHDWIDSESVLQDDLLYSLILPAHGRFGSGSGLADDEALMFKGGKAEQLVLEEWAAEGEASVVVADLLLVEAKGSWLRRLHCD